jgi:hypothetical protein
MEKSYTTLALYHFTDEGWMDGPSHVNFYLANQSLPYDFTSSSFRGLFAH